jgi:2-dehydro-3-deoxygalactonokinase
MARPEKFAARLFGLRAPSLPENLRPERARARLSGLLIGLELAGSRPYWLGREVALIGHAALARTYRSGRALSFWRRSWRTPPR